MLEKYDMINKKHRQRNELEENDMLNKPIIEATKIKSLKITIQYVFRANFNDTYWLEEMIIDLNELKNSQELIWFDPFNGRSKENDTLVAISYVSDEKFIVLEKKKDIVSEKVIENISEHILCEDFDESMLLAAHISLWS